MCRQLTYLASFVLLLGPVNSTLALGPATDPSPADGAAYEDTWVSLAWQPGEGAILHDVYFGDNLDDVASGAGGTFQGSQDSTIFVVGFPGFPYPEGLVPGRTYYWRIDEIYEPNMWWPGDVWSFSIAPRTAHNPDPADGAEGVAVDAILSWSPGPTAVWHDVYLGTNPDFGDDNYVGRIMETVYWHAPPFIPLVTYYWRVDEVEVDGDTIHTGDVWRFTTGSSGPPPPLSKAINPYPADGSTYEDTWVNLAWQPGEGAILHDVYFGDNFSEVNNGTGGTYLARQDATSFIVGLPGSPYSEGLVPGTTYYWRIDEVAGEFEVARGDIWSFSIPPGMARDPEPPDGAVIEDTWADLSWQPGLGAILHDVYFGDSLSDVSNGTGGTYRARQDSTTFVVGLGGFPYPEGLVAGRTYYWRIDEVASEFTVVRGAIWTFAIAGAPPPPRPSKVINPSPSHGATNQSINVVMSWENGGGATSYEIYFGTNPTPDGGEYRGSQDSTVFYPGTLDYDRTYYWRIDARNSAGITRGDVWRFTTTSIDEPPPLPPNKAINLSPGDGATNQSVNVVVRWRNGGRATSYGIYFGADPTPDAGEYKGIQTGTSYDPGPLNYSTTYYWRIDSTNAAGTTPGDVWRFTTETGDGDGGGVRAEYFAGTVPIGTPCLTLVEPDIDHVWGAGPVACDLSNRVSARWTADLDVPVTGTYTFDTADSDDGALVWLDGRLILDNWTTQNTSEPLELAAGLHALRMEWFDNTGNAVARLRWQTPQTGFPQIIPQNRLLPPQLSELPDGTGTVIWIDSFEHYTNNIQARQAVFQTWVDGGTGWPLRPAVPDLPTGNQTGSILGHDIWSPGTPYTSIMETEIVYSGNQSLPVYYDNSESPFYSQVDLPFRGPQDWTANGIGTLSLWLHGSPGNDPAELYILIEDASGSATEVSHPDLNLVRRDGWFHWNIALSDLVGQVNLNEVTKISLGMRGAPYVGIRTLADVAPAAHYKSVIFVDAVKGLPSGAGTGVARVHLYVREAAPPHPWIEGATIHMERTSPPPPPVFDTTTDENGRGRLGIIELVPGDEYFITVEKAGYDTYIGHKTVQQSWTSLTFLLASRADAHEYPFEGVLPQDILDYGQPSDPEFSTDTWFYLDIPDAGTIADLDVKLNIDHQRGSDLKVVLFDPTDHTTGVVLALDAQENLDWMDGSDTIFDDDDVTGDASEIYRKPVGNLSDFNGKSMRGEWALRITDYWPDDVGKLSYWSLIVRLEQ